jgi:hypothetical protein
MLVCGAAVSGLLISPSPLPVIFTFMSLALVKVLF